MKDVFDTEYATQKQTIERLQAELAEFSKAYAEEWQDTLKEVLESRAALALSTQTADEALRQFETRVADETARKVIERCAVAAWVFYAEVCKRKGLNPHHHGEWIASNAIRALLPAAPEVTPAVEPNNDEVICPSCCHQFRAIPVNVQRMLIGAGIEPPFLAAPKPGQGDQAEVTG